MTPLQNPDYCWCECVVPFADVEWFGVGSNPMVNSREKGKAFERQIARALRTAMPGVPIARGLQGRGGGEVPDVDCPVFWVECKHGGPAKAHPRKALEQATRDASPGRVPLAITKQNRHQPIVSMRLGDFLGFVEEWWRARSASTSE